MREIPPPSIHPLRRLHGVEVLAGWHLLSTSGQLGIAADERIPDDAEGQAGLCLEAILAEAGVGLPTSSASPAT